MSAFNKIRHLLTVPVHSDVDVPEGKAHLAAGHTADGMGSLEGVTYYPVYLLLTLVHLP